MKYVNAIENRFQAISDKLDTWEARIESWQDKASFIGVVVGSILTFFLAAVPFVFLLRGLFDAH